jgi:adenylate kinase family enzyme
MSHRISVVGTIGAGKTTIARQISQRLNIPHIELDSLHWEPNWVEAPVSLFRERVTRAVSADSWVADGNYHQVRDIVWGRADTVVWLDYRLTTILLRLAQRTLKRIFTRERLWNANVERLSGLLSRDSVFWWAFKTYKPRKRIYPRLLGQRECSGLSVVRLESPKGADYWVSKLQ